MLHARAGRIFYFRPGCETYSTHDDAIVQQVIADAMRWAASTGGPALAFGNRPPLEKLSLT